MGGMTLRGKREVPNWRRDYVKMVCSAKRSGGLEKKLKSKGSRLLNQRKKS